MRLPRPLPPYFHPTAVILVDDNYRFSAAVRASAPDDLVLTTYLSPEQALHEVNQPHPREALVDMCFSSDGFGLQLDLDVLEEEIKRPDRFDRLAVVLVDYSMPTLGGLEFCAAVEDRDIRRVLLTGVREEKTAVAAFNERLIEHYLPKTKLTAPSDLHAYIEEQQHRYFQAFLTRITTSLGIRPPEFTTNAGFLDYFESIVLAEQIVEFYLVTNPWGYLLLTAEGKTLQVIVQDQKSKAEVEDILDKFNAPEGIQQKVRSGAEMLCLFEHPNDYLGDEPFPWQELTFEAKQVDKHLWCTLVRDPPLDIDFDPQSTCYAQHLKRYRQR